MRRAYAAILVAVGLGLIATEARAQDARWTPWLGCWDMVRENVREGSAVPGAESPMPTLPSSSQRPTPRVCVAPAGVNGARLTTTIDGQPALEQTVVSDGTSTPIQDNSCRGTQRSEWSQKGIRLFAHAELTCDAQLPRTVSGMSLITADGTWLEIRTVRLGANETTRVSRYRRVPGETGPGNTVPPSVAGSRLTLDDVKEASANVSPRVVEAALVETRAGFDLTSRQLIDLSDAQVPATIIDLMVALSYPERFVVERSLAGGSGLSGPLSFDPFQAPFGFGGYDGFYDDFLFPAYFYSPFAYSYLGRFDPRYFSGYYGGYPGVIVGGGGGSIDPDKPQPSGSGRVINGVGYTRVRPREAEPTTTSTRTKTSTAATDSTPSSQGSSSGSTSGTVSGSGFSSGSSSGDSGRTAQPR